MVVMSLDLYDRLTDNIESKLDEADMQAKTDPTRYTHEEVFSSIRNQIGKNNVNIHTEEFFH